MLFERKKTKETSVFEQLGPESITSKLTGVTGRLYQEGDKRRRHAAETAKEKSSSFVYFLDKHEIRQSHVVVE